MENLAQTRPQGMATNTEKQAKIVRDMFLDMRKEQPDATASQLISELVERLKETSPTTGNYVHVVGSRKPPSLWTVREYLRGDLSGTMPRSVGSDLVPELRKKPKSPKPAVVPAPGLGLIERLDDIDRQVRLIVTSLARLLEIQARQADD